MEDDGRGEAAAEAKVTPLTSDVELTEVMPGIVRIVDEYNLSRTIWRNEDVLYSLYYRDWLTETEKENFLKVPARDLHNFCKKRDPSGMLSDAVMFFKLHNTWEVYICPIPECLCWFSEDDSLILHMIYEHFNAWPFLRQNPTEEQWCAQALRSTVWKPIDVSFALNSLSAMPSHLDAGRPDSLDWPLSEDFRRSKLLGRLQTGLVQLLEPRKEDSNKLRSYGCLRALIAVASEEILGDLDPKNVLPLHFRAHLYCSPLSFRFMESDALRHFVDLVEGLCNLTRAFQNRDLEEGKNNDVNWSKSQCPDAVSFSVDSNCFALDGEKLLCEVEDVGLWFHEAPIFPNTKELLAQSSLKASEFLQQGRRKAASFSECLRTIHAQSNLKPAGLTSCLKIWNMGNWPTLLSEASSPELASNGGSSGANVKDISSCYSFTDLAKCQRTEFHSQRYLELIKLTWELQFFEHQVRQCCVLDLRVYILALLRSFLRMKLYLVTRLALEDTGHEGPIREESREKHPEEHVHKKVKGEPAAEDVMVPDPIDIEELSTVPLELGSSRSSVIGVSNDDPMMIDSADAEGEEPRGACAGDTGSRVSQVASADAALSKSRTCIAAAVAESGAKPEAIPKSDAGPESRLTQEFQVPVCCDFYWISDSDVLSEHVKAPIDKSRALKELSEMRRFSHVLWLMRGKCAWETKRNGIFVCMTINDVIKDCQDAIKDCKDEFGSPAAQIIWRWKTNRSWKYWICFKCDKSFPDQKSHMLHMECQHNLGLSWHHDWLVPSQIWQEGQSIVIKGVKGRTHSLDDSITVDSTYRTFIVELEMLKSSHQKEKGCEAQTGNLFGQRCDTERQIKSLVDVLDTKCKLHWTSESGELDAEIGQTFAKLTELKQELSNLCVSDYKDSIMPSICFFLQKRNLDSEFSQWVLRRFKELLSSIRLRCLPDSFSINLASPVKVIINIDEHNAGIRFAYVGICLEFSGVLPSIGSREVKGIFMFSGVSDSGDGVSFDHKLILNKDIKMTAKMSYFEVNLEGHLVSYLMTKLPQFQDECRGKIQGYERLRCVSLWTL